MLILPIVTAVAGADPQSAENSALVIMDAMAMFAGSLRSLRFMTSNKSPAIFELARNSAIKINRGIISVVTLVA
jgi:hypothetical protein